ncbi:MAG: nitroreductase [Rickettsiales bacterium]
MNANLNALLTRRSTSVRDLTAPAPNDAELEQILRAATRVPDHGKLAPWRIVVLRGEGAAKLGDLAADIYMRNTPEAEEKHREHERQRFLRAPLCLAVIATPKESIKAPDWEQYLSAGAVCMNILHAAHALGYGTKWLSEWVAYDAEILAALLAPAAVPGNARIAGFIYLGTKTAEPEERERPELGEVVEEFR